MNTKDKCKCTFGGPLKTQRKIKDCPVHANAIYVRLDGYLANGLINNCVSQIIHAVDTVDRTRILNSIKNAHRALSDFEDYVKKVYKEETRK